MVWFLAVKENIKGAEVAPCLKVETCRENTFLDCVSSGGYIVTSEKITYDFLKLNPIPADDGICILRKEVLTVH